MANIYISPELVNKYQQDVVKQSSPATAKRKTASLKKFLGWAKEAGYAPENPLAEAFETPKSSSLLPSKPARPQNVVGNILKFGLLTASIIIIFLLLGKVKLPISFKFAPAFEGLINGPTPSPMAIIPTSAPQQVPSSIIQEQDPLFSKIYKDGVLTLEGLAPTLRSIGNLLIQGGSILLSTPTASDGNITINPDGSGKANFIFEGTSGNLLSAQDANLNSGSLYYGAVANNSAGYYLINLQSGSNLTSKFSVDALGNTQTGSNLNVVGNLSTNGTTRLSSSGGLSNITGYSQNSGSFTINQNVSDSASITKKASALSDLLTLSLDERSSPSSIYSTLTLKRYDGAIEAMALNVDQGNAKFNGQLELGRFSSNPTAIGQGSLVFNTGDTNVYVWTGSGWVSIGGGTGGDTTWQKILGVISPTTSTDDLAIGGTTSSAPFFVNDSGNLTLTASSGVPATITNTGTSNSFVVNDEASDTTPFVVDASGKVGIGLSNPGSPLSITSAASQFAQFNVANSSLASYMGFNTSGSTTGYFGQECSGGQCIVAGSSANDLVMMTTGTGPNLQFATNGAIRMTVSGGGTVGIGATSLNAALQVGSGTNTHTLGAGDIFTTSDIELDGILYLDGGNISNSVGTATIQFCITVACSTTSQILNTLTAGSWLVKNPSTGNVGQAALAVDQQMASQDILSASASGTPKLTITNDGFVRANAAATATTGTTEATARTNVTTVTLIAAGSFANNDIIFINNAGTDYFTRITAGGGTTTLTVSPAVSYDVSASVTKYTAQVIGATVSNYATLADRYFQGYFTGGIVTGTTSTIYSDNNLSFGGGSKIMDAAGNLQLQAGGTGTGSSGTGSIYFLNSSGTTRGRFDTTGNASFGTGNDGAITISTSKNINTNTIAGGRSYADGIAYRVTAPSSASNSVTRFSASDSLSNGITANDEVLLINLEGASGDTSAVGNYEFLRVSSATTSTVTFTTNIVNSYTGNSASNQRVVIQRVPNYTDVTFSGSGSLTTSAWDRLATTPSGAAGYLTGIVAFRATGTVSVASGTSITADAKGYKDTNFGEVNSGATYQGDSRPGLGTQSNSANDTGGGGGYHASCLSAGGGGGFGASGTQGGLSSSFPSCTNRGAAGGTAGVAALTQLFYGGAGGAGGAGGTNGANGGGGAGGKGGGIVFVAANTLTVTSTGTITANGGVGSDGNFVSNYPSAGGGGGAGGSVFIASANPTLGTTLVTATAGNGGNGGTGAGITAGNGGAGGVGRIRVEYTGSLSGTTNPSASTQTSISSTAQIPGNAYGTFYAGSVNANSADLAEYYISGDFSIMAGDVVAIANTQLITDNNQPVNNKGVLMKTSSPYDSHLIGIISTNPGLVLGSVDGQTGQSDARMLALSGRVPVKIDPDSLPIEIGDFLTSSSKPGYAMKATHAGYTVAKALESWLPPCERIADSVEREVTLNANRCSLNASEKIEAFINLGYYDPDLALNDSGELIIQEKPSTATTLTDLPALPSLDNLASPSAEIVQKTSVISTKIYEVIRTGTSQTVEKVGAFSDFVAANIKAGAIITKDLTADSLKSTTANIGTLIAETKIISPTIETNLLSPTKDNNLVINLKNSAPDATESAFGKLIVKGVEDKNVASIDESGNATFSGQLSASEILSNQVTTNQLTASGNASIAGTLYADNIITKDGQISREQLEKLLKQVESDQTLLANIATSQVNPSDNISSSQIGSLSLSQLFVTDQAAINSLSLSQSLIVGSDLIIQSVPSASINTLTGPLALQSLAMAPIEIMAGKFKIDTNGDVQISGNLSIAGNIDVGGEAKFNNVTLDKLTIASPEEATPGAIINGEIATNATAGTAIIPKETLEVTIKNPKVTDYTLVYVTPTSPTLNNVLYVKSKEAGKFVVGFSEPITTDVSFNWWVVDLK